MGKAFPDTRSPELATFALELAAHKRWDWPLRVWPRLWAPGMADHMEGRVRVEHRLKRQGWDFSTTNGAPQYPCMEDEATMGVLWFALKSATREFEKLHVPTVVFAELVDRYVFLRWANVDLQRYPLLECDFEGETDSHAISKAMLYMWSLLP